MICSLLSYVAFLVAFVFGLAFLAQERQLKRQTTGILFHFLPPLETLDQVNFLALGIGLWLFTVGMGFGLIEWRAQLGRWWTGDPKEYLAGLLWALYFSLWFVRWRSTLRGHRVAWLSVLGFSLALFTLLGASRLVPSLHPTL